MTKVLFFGRLSDIAGATELELRLPQSVSTLTQLRGWLSADNAALGEALERATVRAAINKVLTPSRGDFPVCDSDEIAFMPPVSGG